MGSAARPAIPALASALRSEEVARIRVAILSAMETIDKHGAETNAALLHALKDGDDSVRRAAEEALERIKKK
jgi:HEAT repeat protein